MFGDRVQLSSRTARPALIVFASVGLLLVACGPAMAPLASPAPPTAAPPHPTAGPASPATSAAPSASATTPFAFSAEAVIGFYESEGLTCADPVPSTTATGWSVRTCEGTDDDGRRIAVGIVTDEAAGLGAGFASVTALPDEDLLEPTDALEALAGFLGAMLGEAPATELLPWLAGHLGDDYGETTVGDVTIATFIEAPDDPTRIWVEVAGPAYLAAPAP